jgi:hypothetical protein
LLHTLNNYSTFCKASRWFGGVAHMQRALLLAAILFAASLYAAQGATIPTIEGIWSETYKVGLMVLELLCPQQALALMPGSAIPYYTTAFDGT